MEKSLTLKDLKAALAPLLEALNCNNAQATEMHAMITNMTTKIDLMDQARSDDAPVVSKTAPKKRTTKKAETTTKTETTAKKVVKRKPKKKGVVDEPDESDEANEANESDGDESNGDESDDSSVSNKKKKPVKQVKGKKSTAVKKTRLPNKWEFFNSKFDEDESYFSAYITEDVIAKLSEENEDDWEELTGEDLRKARRGVYYHYMKDNHDKKLKAMKEAYHEEITTSQPVIATKE